MSYPVSRTTGSLLFRFGFELRSLPWIRLADITRFRTRNLNWIERSRLFCYSVINLLFAFRAKAFIFYHSFFCLSRTFFFFVQSRLSSKKFFLSIETAKALHQQLLYYTTHLKIVKNFLKIFFKKFFHFSFKIVFFMCNG